MYLLEGIDALGRLKLAQTPPAFTDKEGMKKIIANAPQPVVDSPVLWEILEREAALKGIKGPGGERG